MLAGMNAALPLSIERRPVESDAAALALAAQAWPEIERPGQLAALLKVVQSGEGEQLVLLVARRGGQLCGAVLAQVLAGRTAVVWPPQAIDGRFDDCGKTLLEELEQHLRAAGLYFAQAVLEADHGGGTELLHAAGFVTAGELTYMAAGAATFPRQPPQFPLQLVEASALAPERLERLVQRTYRGSLDCPLVDGLRPVADVLAGYRSAGQHRPEWWLIACETTADSVTQEIGCLLLSDHPQDEQIEIVYLGIVPECRGQNRGLMLTRHAQWLAQTAGRSRVVLAVDSANWPARRAYEAARFVAWDRRTVLIRDFRQAEKPTEAST